MAMYPSSTRLPILPHPPLCSPLLCWPAPLGPSQGRFLPQLGVLGCVAACLYWSVDFLVAACTYLNIPRPLLFVPGLVQSPPPPLPPPLPPLLPSPSPAPSPPTSSPFQLGHINFYPATFKFSSLLILCCFSAFHSNPFEVYHRHFGYIQFPNLPDPLDDASIFERANSVYFYTSPVPVCQPCHSSRFFLSCRLQFCLTCYMKVLPMFVSGHSFQIRSIYRCFSCGLKHLG